MGEILRTPSGKAMLLTPRSASHSIALAALESFWPDKLYEYNKNFANNTSKKIPHPAVYFPQYEAFVGQTDLAIILRNPVERFRSTCAHRPQISIEQHLANPFYKPLPQGQWVKIFLFETQLQECADWLGITVPLEQIDPTEENDKPTLTSEQENIVKQIYANDMALWESLSIATDTIAPITPKEFSANLVRQE
jgi:hypothetical protein